MGLAGDWLVGDLNGARTPPTPAQWGALVIGNAGTGHARCPQGVIGCPRGGPQSKYMYLLTIASQHTEAAS